MTAPFAPALWTMVFSMVCAAGAKNPGGLPSEGTEEPIHALAASNRERWEHPKGEWDFKPDSLTGSGDCRIAFRGPFTAPFAVDFRINVLKGMRPRVFLGPLTFANEKYDQTFALYPEQKDAVPFSYQNNKDYEVSIAVERDGATLTIDGRKVMSTAISFDKIEAIGFSGGDWWSKGSTRFSEIIVRNRSGTPAAPAAVVPAERPAPNPPTPSAALKEAFEKDLATSAEDQRAAGSKLLAEYGGELEKLSERLRAEKRYSIAGAALAEKARVDAKAEIVEEKLSTAPFEVLTARANYLEKKRALQKAYEAKAAERAARYLGALEEAIAAAGEGNAEAARAHFGAERARLVKAGALKERATKRTRAAGGGGGGPFEDIAPEGSLLSGLVLHTGDFAGHHVLVAVQPIFRGEKGTKLGPHHGEPRGEAITLDAKPGYAVGAINVNSGDRVDGLEIVFMKIKPGGLELDPADTYKSAWIGGGDGGPGAITANGNPVVGIFGANGLELDSLGLIELVPAKSANVGNQREKTTTVSRENPAELMVAELAAEKLVEAPDKESGKWQKVPAELRGAMIHASTPNKHLGVADFKTNKAGRVYLACNYEYQGNPSGNWLNERWTEEDFLKNGWTRVEGCELRSWEGRTFVIFTRELKANESGRLRCNKYEPPYFITFHP